MRLHRPGLLITALVALLAPACGSSASAPPPPVLIAGAPAATVLDVTGLVTARRGGQSRALVVGDILAGDDELQTGADGRVTVRLLHNDATMSLPPGRSQLISTSAAWTLAKATTAPVPSDEVSAAAGRHTGEREVDTAASIGAGAVAMPRSPDEAAAPGRQAARPIRSERASDDAADKGTSVPQRLGKATAAPTVPTATITTGGRGGDSTDESPQSRNIAPPPPPPPPPLPPVSVPIAPAQTEEHKAPPSGRLTLTSAGALTATQASALLSAIKPGLAACKISATGTLTLRIGADGRVTAASVTALPDAQRTCIVAAASKQRITGATSTTTVTATVQP